MVKNFLPTTPHVDYSALVVSFAPVLHFDNEKILTQCPFSCSYSGTEDFEEAARQFRARSRSRVSLRVHMSIYLRVRARAINARVDDIDAHVCMHSSFYLRACVCLCVCCYCCCCCRRRHYRNITVMTTDQFFAPSCSITLSSLPSPSSPSPWHFHRQHTEFSSGPDRENAQGGPSFQLGRK